MPNHIASLIFSYIISICKTSHNVGKREEKCPCEPQRPKQGSFNQNTDSSGESWCVCVALGHVTGIAGLLTLKRDRNLIFKISYPISKVIDSDLSTLELHVNSTPIRSLGEAGKVNVWPLECGLVRSCTNSFKEMRHMATIMKQPIAKDSDLGANQVGATQLYFVSLNMI